MAKIINSIGYLTTEEAAQQLRTTQTRILMLLKGEALEGMQLDGEWLVAGDSVACFNIHGKDLKKPGGCVSHCSAASCGCK